MREIILSFTPKWYDKLESGEKVFEHRKRFSREKVKAYVYLGKPIHFKKDIFHCTIEK